MKLDVTTDAPDFVCMVCGTEGQWNDAAWTEMGGKDGMTCYARCPKCGEDGMLISANEARDIDDFLGIREGAKERILAMRKKLGIATEKKVKLP